MDTRGRLRIDHGLLLWQYDAGSSWTTKVLRPDGPDLAFTFGIDPYQVQRAAGNAVTPVGDTLTLMTQTFRRVG